MNKNILIVLGGALLVAFLVAMLVQMVLGGKKSDAPTVQEAKVEILVASKDLSIGRALVDGDLRWQEWPKSSVFPGAVIRDGDQKETEALEGRLARDVAKGEPVMKSALIGQVRGNLVAGFLEPGQRAVAISVDASSMVGGFIGPGDYVDVILTYRESIRTKDDDPRVTKMLELNLDKLATETILQNVKVLAVDQMAERPEDDEKIKVGKTITIAVSAQDAERLFLASKLGDLTLALRGVGDSNVVEKSWPTISDARLTHMSDEIYEEYDKMKKDAGINSDIVRIYSGGNIEVMPVQ
ncbi:MAG: Flp pilus assembly protein CpaB [Alphaproteobacteria bacterium]|nr:Flp pilus assembly protein CpaB [Alphaproteobacteria bacterium]